MDWLCNVFSLLCACFLASGLRKVRMSRLLVKRVPRLWRWALWDEDDNVDGRPWKSQGSTGWLLAGYPRAI